MENRKINIKQLVSISILGQKGRLEVAKSSKRLCHKGLKCYAAGRSDQPHWRFCCWKLQKTVDICVRHLDYNNDPSLCHICKRQGELLTGVDVQSQAFRAAASRYES